MSLSELGFGFGSCFLILEYLARFLTGNTCIYLYKMFSLPVSLSEARGSLQTANKQMKPSQTGVLNPHPENLNAIHCSFLVWKALFKKQLN